MAEWTTFEAPFPPTPPRLKMPNQEVLETGPSLPVKIIVNNEKNPQSPSASDGSTDQGKETSVVRADTEAPVAPLNREEEESKKEISEREYDCKKDLSEQFLGDINLVAEEEGVNALAKAADPDDDYFEETEIDLSQPFNNGAEGEGMILAMSTRIPLDPPADKQDTSSEKAEQAPEAPIKSIMFHKGGNNESPKGVNVYVVLVAFLLTAVGAGLGGYFIGVQQERNKDNNNTGSSATDLNPTEAPTQAPISIRPDITATGVKYEAQMYVALHNVPRVQTNGDFTAKKEEAMEQFPYFTNYCEVLWTAESLENCLSNLVMANMPTADIQVEMELTSLNNAAIYRENLNDCSSTSSSTSTSNSLRRQEPRQTFNVSAFVPLPYNEEVQPTPAPTVLAVDEEVRLFVQFTIHGRVPCPPSEKTEYTQMCYLEPIDPDAGIGIPDAAYEIQWLINDLIRGSMITTVNSPSPLAMCMEGEGTKLGLGPLSTVSFPLGPEWYYPAEEEYALVYFEED